MTTIPTKERRTHTSRSGRRASDKHLPSIKRWVGVAVVMTPLLTALGTGAGVVVSKEWALKEAEIERAQLAESLLDVSRSTTRVTDQLYQHALDNATAIASIVAEIDALGKRIDRNERVINHVRQYPVFPEKP